MNGGPPDVRGLIHALVYPSSNEQYVRDQATLTDLFKQPEFFLHLHSFALDRSLSQPERLLASVITARELKTKWRSKTLVPEARKPEMRAKLMAFLDEEDNAIARPQLALLVAVSRIELPRAFTELPGHLIHNLEAPLVELSHPPHQLSQQSAVRLLNTVWTINALVKEWRTVKLASGAEVMKALEEHFYVQLERILEVYRERRDKEGGGWVLEEAARYAFKTLARFGQWHWSRAKNLQPELALHRIQTLLNHSVSHAPLLQSHRLALLHQPRTPPDPKLLRALYKHLRAIGKWWRVMIGMDAKAWCKLPGATSGVGWWWGEVGGVVAGSDGAVANDDEDTTPYPKRFLLLGMLLFKDILPILAVDHPEIWTPSFILSALHLLIDKLLPLASTDLEALEDEPEEWLIRENTDEEAWAYEFRPCAERVLMALNNSCRSLPHEHKVIEPEMLKILGDAEARPADDLPGILRREAVYCALGRLSRSLSSYGGVDFNAFLGGSSRWLSQGIPMHRILKRRLAWLIGQWVTSEEDCAKLPIIWELLVHLLGERGEASDRAVTLSAAIAIRECVDLWELDIVYFEPYLQKTVQELLKLLGECETLDGKRYVNETIGVVIERTGDKMMPFLPTLAQAIPTLWHGASGLEGEWLFKASLVVLTTKLVSAAKDSSGNLMELVIPLIEESLVPPAKDFFEEDGIILWQTALHNSSSPYHPSHTTGLIRLLPGLLSILSENMDLLPRLLPLLDSYLLLDTPGILSSNGSLLCSCLQKALTASKPSSDTVKRILTTLSLLVRLAPLPVLAPLLLDSGLFQHILTALEDDKASGLILAAYLDVVVRSMISNAGMFLDMIRESARRQGRDEYKVSEEGLDAVWRNFDYVSEARARKAVAMGVGALLLTGEAQCLERLDGEFMNIFLDVLGEVQQDESGQETGVQHWKADFSVQWAEVENTPEGHRRQSLEDADPAFHAPLKGYVMDVLTRAQQVGLGPYWDKADEGTKNSLLKFLA